MLLLLHVDHFYLRFEFSLWVLNFACFKLARILIRGALILRFFYNREKREIKDPRN